MRAKLREVVCVECKTRYWIPAAQKRLKSYETCGNTGCDCRKFRAAKKRGSTKEGK